MANRSYLYALSNRPRSYSDRPERIEGLSEWPYDVPFLYRLLASGDTQACASLISEGLEDEDADGNVTSRGPLHAISGDYTLGFARVERFLEAARIIATTPPAPAAAEPEPEPGLFARVARALSGGTPAAPKATAEAEPPANTELFLRALEESAQFLAEHRDSHVLLETIEVDIMSENDIDRLAAMVDEEVERCRRAGAAVDALPADPQQAAAVLARAAQKADQPVLEPFEGLRFDDECDDRDQLRTMGVFHWTTVLYFALWNKAQYEAEHGTVEG